MEIEVILRNEITFLKEVTFEDATNSSRDENTIDIFHGEKGTFVITEPGQLYEVEDFNNEVIQFVIAEVSDVYFFEKYSGGKLVRRYINLQGSMEENFGEGIISGDKDLMDRVWSFVDEYLQIGAGGDIFGLKFRRYELQ
ncbi:hypothetical protein DBR43_09620 [Pedobacter sp. KBW06]|nr:hypothetical protein DBR43_09620 [Pedobacter sp. KBW06]